MKKRVPDKFWFPWWPGKWIFGSVRIEFNPAERGIWVDLLSFASMDDGHIRANEETPYPLQQLAGMLIIPEKELDAAINKFIKFKKLTKLKSGTLYVTKWDKYQFSDRHKLRIAREQGEVFTPEYSRMTPCPEEFKDMATKKGYVRVSRLKIAEAIGRSLKSEERVHHIDGNDTNEKIENLMLFKNNQDHLRFQHGQECEILWRGDEGGVVKSDMGVIRKDAYNILDNSTLNNNKLDNKECNYILKFLSEVKNYPYNEKRDLGFIKGLIADFPDLDALEEIKKKCAWWLSNPILKNSNPHLQLRNWFLKARQFLKEGDKSRDVGKSYMKEDEFLPMEILNKAYKIILRGSGDISAFYNHAKSAFPKIKAQWERSDKKPETFIKLVEECDKCNKNVK